MQLQNWNQIRLPPTATEVNEVGSIHRRGDDEVCISDKMAISDRLAQLKFFRLRINILHYAAILTHNIGFVFTPLSKELVKLSLTEEEYTRAKDFQSALLMSDGVSPVLQNIVLSNGGLSLGYDKDESLHLAKYLTKPSELIHLVKRYHLVGNKCIISIFVQVSAALYLCTKMVFHSIYTRDDPELGNYYASHYFPRLFESYPDPYELYGVLGAQCFQVLIIRLYLVGRLLRKSILNQNGYREIEMSQLNGMFVDSLKWPLIDWFRLSFMGLRHRSVCDRSDRLPNRGLPTHRMRKQEKQAHLHSRYWDPSVLIGSIQTRFFVYANPIDFTKCYQYYGLELDGGREPDYFYPQANCRLDVWEFSLVVLLTIVGVPIIIVFLIMILVFNFMTELAVLSPNKFESSMMERLLYVPDLLFDFNHLVRLTDIYLFHAMLLPHIIEEAVIYLDIFALLSRIRKVHERLEEDLDMCIELRTLIGTENPLANSDTKVLTLALNKSLEQNLILAKTVNDEFIMIQHSTTTYLDLILLGGGFCIATTSSVLFITKSRLIQFTLVICTLSASLPMILTSLLCMAVEIRVSTEKNAFSLAILFRCALESNINHVFPVQETYHNNQQVARQ